MRGRCEDDYFFGILFRSLLVWNIVDAVVVFHFLVR